jgi:YgiT-type zinc finger domain-containing protein
MRCALCGGEVLEQEVTEELVVNDDRFLVVVKAEVCQSCSECYYPEGTVDQLIKLKEAIKEGKLKGREVGKVYRLMERGAAA